MSTQTITAAALTLALMSAYSAAAPADAWWVPQRIFTQVGAAEGARTFVIGMDLLLPVYRSHEKVFSTGFKSGDHLPVGARFGQAARHTSALRAQHRSNAGDDCLQLRHTRQL
jgi:Lipid A 3-O-deacylase (PagL)